MSQYAFWKAEEYPYVTGGEVLEVHQERVKIKGQGHKLFFPLALVEVKKGEHIQTALNTLRKEYTQQINELKTTYETSALQILEQIKN